MRPNNLQNSNRILKSTYINKKTVAISIIIFVISLLSSLIILSDNQAPNYYKLLFLLPLTFGLLNLIYIRINEEFDNIGILAIWSMLFFRLIVTPIFMRFGDYYSVMKINIERNIYGAIWLVVYEVVIVFLTIYFIQQKEKYKSIKNIQYKNLMSLLIFLMSVFILYVYFFHQNSITSFKTILDMGTSTFTTWTGLGSNRFNLGTYNRIIATLFTMIFSWYRYLLPIAIFIWLKNHIKSNLISITLSMIPIVLQVFFITATILDAFLCMFVLFLVLVKLYPKYRRILYVSSIISFLSIVFTYFYISYILKDNNNIMRFISENANAYMSGIDNVAATFNMPYSTRLSTYFFNIYGAIPFNSTLFGLTGDKLAAIFNASNYRIDGHIPPTIGSGLFYYGPIFAPIESVIFTIVAVKFGSKAKAEKNIWRYAAYILISIMMAMGFNAYNSSIVLNYFTTLLIPILFVSRFSNNIEESIKIKKVKNEKII